MDVLYEKLDEPQGEKFAIRLAKARHRACVDIRAVKTVKSADVQEEQPTEGLIPSWMQEEVRSAIRKMKLGKAAGPDGVPVEAWKGKTPDDSRLRGMVAISHEQWGFMPKRSTTDAIFIARHVMEKYREKRRPCHLAFLNL
ncbi:unnamed protein product [Heligmosomoides polygyrus]|uniref:RT_RNaseH_2 domain-containing protein n=1 Tax=Heligmosomoides polygyrus TaxID=6339 RepID=A0A183G661_HELPZ|nr:unnamed protein product [Heligmosomoides polygyrus]